MAEPNELAEAERCGRYTGHGEACDYPRAEYSDACGFHLAEDNRRLRAELETTHRGWDDALTAFQMEKEWRDRNGSIVVAATALVAVGHADLSRADGVRWYEAYAALAAAVERNPE